jgi:hypothetical protein
VALPKYPEEKEAAKGTAYARRRVNHIKDTLKAECDMKRKLENKDGSELVKSKERMKEVFDLIWESGSFMSIKFDDKGFKEWLLTMETVDKPRFEKLFHMMPVEMLKTRAELRKLQNIDSDGNRGVAMLTTVSSRDSEDSFASDDSVEFEKAVPASATPILMKHSRKDQFIRSVTKRQRAFITGNEMQPEKKKTKAMVVPGTEKVSVATSKETKTGSVENKKSGVKGTSLTSTNTNKSSRNEPLEFDKDDETESDE